MSESQTQWPSSGADRNCSTCFFKAFEPRSDPCRGCSFNPDWGPNMKKYMKDKYVTDSDVFWKDTPKPGEEVQKPWPFPQEDRGYTDKELEDAVNHLKGLKGYRESSEQEYTEAASQRALDVQVSGDHYKSKSIQPIEYIHANQLGFCEGNVVKYITRWRDKGGKADLEKVKHYVDLLIQLEGL